LRAVWVKALLAQRGQDQPIWIAVDASGIERAEAQTSEDRGIIHLSNLPLVDKPIGVGWMFSTVVLLEDEPSSWAPILDQARIPTDQTPIQVAIAQLQALKARLGNASRDRAGRPGVLYPALCAGLPRPGLQLLGAPQERS
jgi:hypothetical protein